MVQTRTSQNKHRLDNALAVRPDQFGTPGPPACRSFYEAGLNCQFSLQRKVLL
jgi:hypothetical protein